MQQNLHAPTPHSPLNETDETGWQASLSLAFEQRATKTVLAKRQHYGPLRVQRPFYPEGGLCHVYLLHPPGGVVAGDRLQIDVHAGAQTAALITTPAAGKFYRSEGAIAEQSILLRVDKQAALEWLPQENLLFNELRLQAEVRVELAEGARFIGWEISALGRPASGQRFTAGEAKLQWHIFRTGKPLFLETMHLDAQSFQARWGLNGHAVFGTLFVSPATPQHLHAVQELIADSPGRGATLCEDLLICRALDHKTEVLKQFFATVRSLLRQDIIQYRDCAPRIWAT